MLLKVKAKKGQIQVSTENIFPIIRQWLYSDRDIFLRELISNAADSLTKLRQLANLGELNLTEEELRIEIRLLESEGKLLIADNGIGMTIEEVDKYINQIAYSGMTDFVTKYQDRGQDNAGFIGHFGLGFYSSFMVADKVEIDTLSWQENAVPALWHSEEGIEYEIKGGQRSSRGTSIILHLTEEDKEWLNPFKVKEIIDKYAHFLPWPIYFISETELDEEQAKSTDMLVSELKDLKPVNITSPLWLKQAAKISDEEYIDFYQETFKTAEKPLFWVHLNMDYPFRLKGILYFPQIGNRYQTLEGRILIFYNQVFVADNIKEIVPEFLFLLQGVLDSPDLPLNVSRSFLQTDPNFKRLSQHIVKKLGDRLNKFYQEERELYEEVWPKLNLFVKYGVLSDPKFYENIKGSLIYPKTSGGYIADAELPEETILYTPAKDQLTLYVRRAEEREKPVLIMDQEIDAALMSYLEFSSQGKRRFVRVDADFESKEGQELDFKKLLQLFPAEAEQEVSELRTAFLGEKAPPAVLHESEEMRRMREISEQMGLNEEMAANIRAEIAAAKHELILNEDSRLTEKFIRLSELAGKEEEAKDLAAYIYALTKLSQDKLTGDELADFINQAAELAVKALELN